MQENQLFEYAIVRIVPRVEREEFLNVGVILYCRPMRFLQMKFHLDPQRVLAIFPAADLENIRCHLEAFERIAQGHPDAGPIAALDIASRFRWLTAKRSTVVQTSAVHPGLSGDSLKTLETLHEQLVLSPGN